MKQLTIIIIHTFLSCHKVITSEAVNVKMTELSESHRQGQKIADDITVYLYETQNNIYVAHCLAHIIQNATLQTNIDKNMRAGM